MRTQFVDLTCSADGLIVWGLDSGGCLYARVAVFPELPEGSDWTYVEFIAVARPFQIAASKSAVWILTADGEIYRRAGLTPTNWAGTVWERIPKPWGSKKVIGLTVSQCDTAWCLDLAMDIHQLARTHHISLQEDLEDEDWTLLTS